jgi:hypothetical protein
LVVIEYLCGWGGLNVQWLMYTVEYAWDVWWPRGLYSGMCIVPFATTLYPTDNKAMWPTY